MLAFGKFHVARKMSSALRGLLRPTALTGLLLAGLLCAAVPSASAVEPGVVLTSLGSSQVPLVSTLGTHWVRVFATWPDLEPQRGTFAQNWFASYEQLFNGLPRGTKVIVDVVDTPSWETGSSNETTPPANPNDYAAFVGQLAERWGSRVAAYELWNEEDSPAWWAGGPNPAAYVQLLKATYPVVKAAEPKATVVLGGLTGNDFQFLEGIYAAGGKGYFDAVGVHTDTACDTLSPYEFLREGNGRMIPDSFLAYREVHAVMVANGDDSPIWMTELSWRTTSATCPEGAWAGQKPEGVSEAQQAEYLKQAYHCLEGDSYVKVALWFDLQDEGGVLSGLLRSNGSRKPAFGAMEEYAHKGDQLSEPCGTFTGPKLSVLSPTNHISYSGPLPIHVVASDPTGVYRIKLEIDGKLIRNYESHWLPKTSSGILMWQHAKHITYGPHRLTIIAYDKQQNPTVVSLTIIHRRPAKRRHGKRHG
jgi:hypothetical protein